MKRYVFAIIFIVVGILCFVVYSYCNPVSRMDQAISVKDYKSIIEIYNKDLLDSEYESYYNDKIYYLLTDLISSFESDRSLYNDILSDLEYFNDIYDTDLMNLSKDYIEYVSIEGNGDVLFKDAMNDYYDKNYIECFNGLSKINNKYSLYSDVDAFYNEVVHYILDMENNCIEEEDYVSYISLLEDCFDCTANDVFLKQRDSVKEEYEEYMSVNSIIEQVESLYINESYREVFDTLDYALVQYKDYQVLDGIYSHYCDLYVSLVSSHVDELVSLKDYDSAIEYLNEAIEIYECDEFYSILEDVKYKKNPFYKISEFFGSLFS